MSLDNLVKRKWPPGPSWKQSNKQNNKKQGPHTQKKPGRHVRAWGEVQVWPLAPSGRMFSLSPPTALLSQFKDVIWANVLVGWGHCAYLKTSCPGAGPLAGQHKAVLSSELSPKRKGPWIALPSNRCFSVCTLTPLVASSPRQLFLPPSSLSPTCCSQTR